MNSYYNKKINNSTVSIDKDGITIEGDNGESFFITIKERNDIDINTLSSEESLLLAVANCNYRINPHKYIIEINNIDNDKKFISREDIYSLDDDIKTDTLKCIIHYYEDIRDNEEDLLML